MFDAAGHLVALHRRRIGRSGTGVLRRGGTSGQRRDGRHAQKVKGNPLNGASLSRHFFAAILDTTSSAECYVLTGTCNIISIFAEAVIGVSTKIGNPVEISPAWTMKQNEVRWHTSGTRPPFGPW